MNINNMSLHRAWQFLDKYYTYIVSGPFIANKFNSIREVNWHKILKPKRSKLPSIATMEGGESKASKIKLFSARFPLSSTWFCAANKLDSACNSAARSALPEV